MIDADNESIENEARPKSQTFVIRYITRVAVNIFDELYFL